MQLGTKPWGCFTSVKPKVCSLRFIGGHKAFLWAWLDKYGDEEERKSGAANFLLGKPCATIGIRSYHPEKLRTPLQCPNPK